MGYRSLRISALFSATAFFAIYVIAVSAAPTAPPAAPDVVRILMPGDSVVLTQDVTPEIAYELNMSQTEGVLVREVSNSPLRPGDVILSVNGNRVRCQTELISQLSDVGAGPLVFEVLRDGRIQTVTIPLARLPLPELGTAEIRGIKVASLPTQDGVIVEDTLIGTPASDAGIKTGDIILDVDGHPVRSAEEFLQFLTQLSNDSATFNILQRNGQINVFVIPA
jgi:serine protease Do